MSTSEQLARLRALAEDCRILTLQLIQLRKRRDAVALALVNDGLTWREVAEAAGFANPYLAELKKREGAKG
jgi:hypothetical protein